MRASVRRSTSQRQRRPLHPVAPRHYRLLIPVGGIYRPLDPLIRRAAPIAYRSLQAWNRPIRS